MTRRRTPPRTPRLALPALALAGVLAALSAFPGPRAARIGDPEATLSCLPAGELPVPDRPERPEVPTSPAIVTSDGLPPLAPVAFARSFDTARPRDGFPPRVERPPAA